MAGDFLIFKNERYLEKAITHMATNRTLYMCSHLLIILGICLLFSTRPIQANRTHSNIPAGVWMHDSLTAHLKSNPLKAIQIGLEILDLTPDEIPDTIRAFTTLHMGYLLDKQGFPMQALAFYLDAARLLEESGMGPKTGYLNIDIGNLYYHQNQFEPAAEKYQVAKNLFHKENNWAGVYTSINNLALIEKALGNYHEAHQLFLDALHIAYEKLDIPYLLAHSYKYIGDLYRAMGQRDSALVYYNKTLNVTVTDPEDNLIGLIREKAASVLLEQGDTLTAIQYLKQAEADFIQNTNLFYLSDLYLTMSDLYFDMHDDNSALLVLDQARELFEKEGMIHHQIQIEKRLIEHYKLTGEKELLIRHQHFLNQLMEKRYESEVSAQIQRVDIQNLLQEYQHKLYIKKLELEKAHIWRNGAFFISLLFLAMLWLLIARYHNRKKTHQKILNQKEKIHVQQLQLEKIKQDQANRELICQATLIQQQKSFLEKLKSDLQELTGSDSGNSGGMLRRAVHAIDRSLQGGQAWRQFETRFTQIFPGFFQHLTAINPALTSQDIKICAYHRMNLDTKEIASLCYLTVRAVQTSRYRLRKKLEIPEEMSFQEFINQI